MSEPSPELDEVRRTWNQLAATDPLWAICSQPDKLGNRWTLDEFMATGVAEIDQLLRQLDDRALRPKPGRALDFGCGVGRLSQALAGHFEHVTGIDISSVMIDQARSHNRFGPDCEYLLNERTDLAVLGDRRFDLIYSNVTLQHMPPPAAMGYIAEFLRLLAADGILVFQLPSHGARWSGRLAAAAPPSVLSTYRRLRHGLAAEMQMQMHGIHRRRVVAAVQQSGGQVVEVLPDGSAGPGWISFRYLVKRSD